MIENIYTGTELGAGGGGGGSTNPTSGVMPVNILGTFQDSLISSDVNVGNGTKITVNDTAKLIQLDAGTSTFVLDGAADDVTIDGTNGIQLQGGVFINNHLGLAILRFLSSGASHAAIKVVGNILNVRNGNDSDFNDLRARAIQASTSVSAGTTVTASGSVTGSSFIVDLKSKLESAVDGIFTLLNNAGTAFTRLCFGGNTSAFPALSRNGANLEVKAADDSAYANLDARVLTGRNTVNSYGSFVFDGTTQRGSISAPLDSVITLLNAAGTDFKFLRFGGNTAAFPMISKASNGLQVRVADDTAYTNLFALDVQAFGKVVSSGDFSVSLKSVLTSLVDSNFTLYNAAKGNFNLLQFGGVSNAFPALKRSATGLQVRLADDSGDAPLNSGAFTSSGQITGTTNFLSSTTIAIIGVSGATPIIRGSIAGVQIAASAGAANASAQLEVVSNTRGFLPPRMTALQRAAIASPAVGLMVYQTDPGVTEGIWTYKSTGWIQGV